MLDSAHVPEDELTMSPDNSVTDRLLNEARKKTARQESPTVGKVAVALGALAMLCSPISIVGWVFGLAAVGTGISAVKRPATAKLAKIAITLGVVAIMVGVFFFSLNLVRM